MTHICVSDLTIIGSDNVLSPGRRQAIIWTNAGILLIRTLGTNFSEILSKIHTFSFKKMHLKLSSVKWRPFCLGLNVLNIVVTVNGSHHWARALTYSTMIYIQISNQIILCVSSIDLLFPVWLIDVNTNTSIQIDFIFQNQPLDK